MSTTSTPSLKETPTVIAPCKECGNPEATFYILRRPSGRMTRQHRCKDCAAREQKRWYEQNREYLLLRFKRRYERQRERMKALRRARYQAEKVCNGNQKGITRE